MKKDLSLGAMSLEDVAHFVSPSTLVVTSDEFNAISCAGLGAAALYDYLRQRPSAWRFSVAGIAGALGKGRYAIRTCVHDLEAAGLLARGQVKVVDAHGRRTWGSAVWVSFKEPVCAHVAEAMLRQLGCAKIVTDLSAMPQQMVGSRKLAKLAADAYGAPWKKRGLFCEIEDVSVGGKGTGEDTTFAAMDKEDQLAFDTLRRAAPKPACGPTGTVLNAEARMYFAEAVAMGYRPSELIRAMHAAKRSWAANPAHAQRTSGFTRTDYRAFPKLGKWLRFEAPKLVDRLRRQGVVRAATEAASPDFSLDAVWRQLKAELSTATAAAVGSGSWDHPAWVLQRAALSALRRREAELRLAAGA